MFVGSCVGVKEDVCIQCVSVKEGVYVQCVGLEERMWARRRVCEFVGSCVGM